ncbi:MAG: hypothetical protein KF774_15455 [Planctomyces sp.]|nr:hypothetical protein [Planctomyces sp.]
MSDIATTPALPGEPRPRRFTETGRFWIAVLCGLWLILGSAIWWNDQSLAIVDEFGGPDGRVFLMVGDDCVAFGRGANEQLLARGPAEVWDLRTRKWVRQVLTQEDELTTVSGQAGLWLISRRADKASLWNLSEDVPRWTIELTGSIHPRFSPDGRLLAIDQDDRLLVLDPRDGSSVWDSGELPFIAGIAFLGNGRLQAKFFDEDGDQNIRVWDTTAWQEELLDHPDDVESVSDDGRYAVIWWDSTTAESLNPFVLDLQTRRNLWSLPEDSVPVLVNGGQEILTAEECWDGLALIRWRTSDGQPVGRASLPGADQQVFTLSPDERIAVVEPQRVSTSVPVEWMQAMEAWGVSADWLNGSEGGKATVLNVETGRTLGRITDDVDTTIFVPTGDHVVGVGFDDTVRTYRLPFVRDPGRLVRWGVLPPLALAGFTWIVGAGRRRRASESRPA